jgi:hypothetical protein
MSNFVELERLACGTKTLNQSKGDTKMRFMVIVKGCDGHKQPSREELAAMGKFNEELTNAGVMLALEGLTPSSQGTRVKFDGKKRTVTDGPFAESKEVLGGFWIWKCKSKQEAIEWLKRAPFEDHEVELREVIDAEDFAGDFARALREHEAGRREAVGAQR